MSSLWIMRVWMSRFWVMRFYLMYLCDLRLSFESLFSCDLQERRRFEATVSWRKLFPQIYIDSQPKKTKVKHLQNMLPGTMLNC